MNPDEIWDEYQRDNRLSTRAMLALKKLLVEGADPYSAITLAGDTAAFELAPLIAPYLKSPDVMVRWNAAAVLFTRFRDVQFAHHCLELLEREADTMVRGVTLSGIGELLPLLEDGKLRKLLANKLREVFEAVDELPEMRDDAYAGIEVAVGIPERDRTPADRRLDLQKDVRPEVITKFFDRYGV